VVNSISDGTNNTTNGSMSSMSGMSGMSGMSNSVNNTVNNMVNNVASQNNNDNNNNNGNYGHNYRDNQQFGRRGCCGPDPCCRRGRDGEYGWNGGWGGGGGGWGGGWGGRGGGRGGGCCGGGWGGGWGGYSDYNDYGNGGCDYCLWETAVTDRCLPGKPAAKLLRDFGYNYARRSGQQWSPKVHNFGAYSSWT